MDIRTQLSGRNLTRLLAKRGMTKYALARATGIRWKTIHFWERGIYKPMPKKAELVAKVLGLE